MPRDTHPLPAPVPVHRLREAVDELNEILSEASTVELGDDENPDLEETEAEDEPEIEL